MRFAAVPAVTGMSDRRQQTTLVPGAQLALMWVSAQMPAHAERILASARTKYVRDSAGTA